MTPSNLWGGLRALTPSRLFLSSVFRGTEVGSPISGKPSQGKLAPVERGALQLTNLRVSLQ